MPPVPWANAAVFPAIWIPDSHQGPRPGYPWVEFGRMALPPDPETAPVPARRTVMPPQTGLPADTLAARGQPAAMLSDDLAVGVSQADPKRFVASPVAPGIAPKANASRTGYAHLDIGAAMEAWNALSDLRSVRAALDATSPPTRIVEALAEMGGDEPPHTGLASISQTAIDPPAHAFRARAHCGFVGQSDLH